MMLHSWCVICVCCLSLTCAERNILRTSGTNCARIYNDGMSDHGFDFTLPADWNKTFEMDVDDVWNGFYLNALLLDSAEHRQLLVLPHAQGMTQRQRLEAAIRARNKALEGPGQEAWNHACDVCCYAFTDENGVQSK